MTDDILIVDDELDIARLVAENLEDEGYTTRCASDGPQALEAVSKRLPSLVILDIWLGDSRFDGMRVLEELMKEYEGLPVVMMSGHGTIETAVSAIKNGAYDFIEKPFKMDRMLLVVERALEIAHLRRENYTLKLKKSWQDPFSSSALIPGPVHQTIERVAPTNSRLLIQGPPGSGKELVAQHVHLKSNRKNHPFTIVQCRSWEGNELTNRLFGEETPSGRTTGLLESSHMGTLYFDEISELNLETQGKLVRFLQEGFFLRQGGSRKISVDVRILGATSKNLSQEVAESRFREDFYYRLNVVPIKMLSLKERLSDFSQIITCLTRLCCEAQGLALKSFADDAVLALKTYDWPGNLNQLKSVIEWTIIMNAETPSEVITSDMLPAEITLQAPTILHSQQASEIMALPLKEARDRFEKDYLLAQVSRFSGNISHTAQFVGMERSALHRKLKNLKIER
jgi:two-component system nitrogen regulation response regulator NtrX